jgi:tetratricopeptide (TPR) repeat protein
MIPDELEQRAERAVRRGELLVAIEHFEAHLAQHPEDERVRSRMEAVRALLQPSELVSRRRTEPEDPEAGKAPASDAEVAEMHAGSGRFAEAAEAYERAVAANPDNELFRERLSELRLLAVPTGKADLASLEKLEGPPPSQANGVPRKPERSAKAHAASFAPLQAAPSRPLPRDPKALLEELLQRVRAGRRG